jgi:hypothetical protein
MFSFSCRKDSVTSTIVEERFCTSHLWLCPVWLAIDTQTMLFARLDLMTRKSIRDEKIMERSAPLVRLCLKFEPSRKWDVHLVSKIRLL